MKQREHKLEDGFIFEGFEYKGITYKALTAQSILILKKVNSGIYTGDTSDWLETLLDYMFATSQPKEALFKAVNNWQESIWDYAAQFSHEDLMAIGKIVSGALEDSAAALVEVQEEGEKKPVTNPVG